VNLNGNALEARIYSEDPENGMMPSPGRIHYVSFPSGRGIRVDTGAISGSQILPDYDPLIAKIMVHGNSRNAAISEMKKAVGETVITGLHHNLALHSMIFSDSDFIDNRLSTGWLEQKLNIFSDALFMQRQSADLLLLCISAALIVFKHTPLRSDSPWSAGFWRNVKQIRFRYGEHVVELEYFRKSIDLICFIHDDSEYNVTSIKSDNNFLEYKVDEKLIKWYYVPEKENVIRLSDGHTEFQIERYHLRRNNYNDIEEMSVIQANTVLAPQPGTIVEIKVSEGQQVSRGDYLLTIESMKLENTILAVTGGIIKKINIKTGDKVSKNEPLIYLQDTITN
jgi:acetyl/propionyl-CoA carboxylase alpha subunit